MSAISRTTLRSLKSLGLLVACAVGIAVWGWWPAPAAHHSPLAKLDVAGEAFSTPLALGNGGWNEVGVNGTGLGEFSQPRGVTGFPDGSFVVVDRKARVQYFDPLGRPLELWTMKDRQLGNPKSLEALPNGHLLVCDTHYGRLLEMTTGGDIIKQWADVGTQPGQFVHLLACAVDAKRNAAYVVEYGAHHDRIQKFDLDGNFLLAFSEYGLDPGQLSRPSGVTVDPDGNVWVADSANHRIQKFSPQGAFLDTFGHMGEGPGELRYPFDIACAPDGKLYVVEFANHRVSVFDTDGNFVKMIGGPGSGAGEFYNPWSLTVDPWGRLLVSDTRNHRVQVLQVSRPSDAVAAQQARMASRER